MIYGMVYSLRVFEDSDYSMEAEDFPSLKECQSPFYHKMVIKMVYSLRIDEDTLTNGPLRDKTCLRGFRKSEIQTSLLRYRY